MVEEYAKKTRAHTIYRDEYNNIVPSVTTILSVLNKPALVKWANNLGLQGIDSSKYTDSMAVIGTIAHYLVECILMGQKPDLQEYAPADVKKAEIAVAKFLEWKRSVVIIPKLIEAKMVSSKYGYGGQIDLYGEVDGKNTLVDFKTCKAIYPEMMFQLAAYKQLLVENGYEVDNAIILRIGRNESEGFEIKKAGSLNDEWSIFEACLKIYKTKEKIGG